MMQGSVNQSREAIIRIAIGHVDALKQMVEAVIDIKGGKIGHSVLSKIVKPVIL